MAARRWRTANSPSRSPTWATKAPARIGDDPQLRVDFAYRGVHQTVLAAKAIVAAFYGRQADHSVFSRLLDGGREGLVEAERYPADFDGVTAGAPAMNFLIQNTFYDAWNARSNLGADGKPIITAKDLPYCIVRR